MATALVIGLFCMTAPALQAQTSGRLITKTTAAQIKAIMEKEGYAVTIDSDGDIVWKIDGLRTLMFIAKDQESLQFHAAFGDGSATLKKVNTWNKSKRYSRSYLDDEGDPHLELDLDLVGGVTEARVVDFLTTCRVSYLTWCKEVVK